MTRLTLALLAATALVAPAAAADVMMDSSTYVEPMAASDWTGFYVGVFGGATFNPAAPGIIEFDQQLDGTFGPPINVGPFPADLAARFGANFIGSREGGFTGGFELGYDHQIGNFVVGVVGDLAFVDYSDVQSGFSSTPASYVETTSLSALGTVRARAGIVIADTILAYVHGGLAAGNVTTAMVTVGNVGVSRGSAGQVGYQVGVGIEGMVSEHVSLGIQYDYTNLGGRNYVTRYNNGPFTSANPLGTDVRGTDQIFDFHAVKGTLKYRF